MHTPRISLTRSKQMDAVCFGTMFAILLYAELAQSTPLWGKVLIAVGAVAAGLGIAIECLIPKEKSDERAVQNLQKADAFILNGIYLIAAWLMLRALWAPELSLVLATGELALAFALLGFLRSALFLAFERLGA